MVSPFTTGTRDWDAKRSMIIRQVARKAWSSDTGLVLWGLFGIGAGFAVQSELQAGDDWQADLEALRDNNELELETDPAPVS